MWIWKNELPRTIEKPRENHGRREQAGRRVGDATAISTSEQGRWLFSRV